MVFESSPDDWQGVLPLQLIDLSHVIVPDMPQWSGDRQPLKIHRRSEHGPDSHMSSSLELGCHVGTHLDGSLHFLDGQPGLHELPVGSFAGPALVIDASAHGSDAEAPTPLPLDLLDGHDLSRVDFVLFFTGWDRHWGTGTYYRHWPWLSDELAGKLASSDLKGVGLDVPSLDHKTKTIAHDLCAAAGMVNLENLTALGSLVDKKVQFMALPLKLYQTEASPVRAVAWLQD